MDGQEPCSHLWLEIPNQGIDIVAGKRGYAGGNDEDMAWSAAPVDLADGRFELCLSSAYDVRLVKGGTKPEAVFHGPLPGGITALHDGVLGMDARPAAYCAMEQDRAVGKAVHDGKGREKLADRSLRKKPISVVHALAVFSVGKAANRASVGNGRMQAVFPFWRFFLVKVAHVVVSL